MPPTASLLLIHYFLVLATVNLVITIPTANEYSERLGAGRLLLGIPGGGRREKILWEGQCGFDLFNRS